jgi:hypothetical protein
MRTLRSASQLRKRPLLVGRRRTAEADDVGDQNAAISRASDTSAYLRVEAVL